ncbi:MAG: glycosyltransferase family 2 protein [Humidesulfovibrio sp.]|nr:glycosyltransferase family 2 protein [Humidesulfovibrio sp.]
MFDVTLYIPCYNAAAYLGRVLPAVMAQTQPIAEVLIIDDGSTDQTAAIAERHAVNARYPLRVIRQPKNMGLAVGRNTAIRAAQTDFIAALDSDVLPAPDWLEHLVLELTEGVSGVGGELLELYQQDLADRWRAVHMVQHRGPRKVYRPPFLWGCNTLFRKQVLVDAGLYPEHCRTNAEDVKLCEAIRDEHVLVYTNLAKCLHLRRDTKASLRRNWWKWYYYGCYERPTWRKTWASNLRTLRRCGGLFTCDLADRDLSRGLLTLSMLPYAWGMDWLDLWKRRKES